MTAIYIGGKRRQTIDHKHDNLSDTHVLPHGAVVKKLHEALVEGAYLVLDREGVSWAVGTDELRTSATTFGDLNHRAADLAARAGITPLDDLRVYIRSENGVPSGVHRISVTPDGDLFLSPREEWE